VVSITGTVVVTVPAVSIIIVRVIAVSIIIVRIIVVTVISVRIAPSPPPRKAEVAEEDIIRESAIVIAPTATPVAAVPVAATPRSNPAAAERVAASH
jgi:hypothetical protein